ncbi:unnamed protein product [Ilex paraguariensis]|uniref:Uncharacterized protein n=1 Tax=Ilex paraguariensis TaxID=185542 RepID=A0ABC8UYI3_9AQUA
MVADRGKKSKVAERAVDDDFDHIEGELVLSIEKLQEVQDELEKLRYHLPISTLKRLISSPNSTISSQTLLYNLVYRHQPRVSKMVADRGKRVMVHSDSDLEEIDRIFVELSENLDKVRAVQDELKKVLY